MPGTRNRRDTLLAAALDSFTRRGYDADQRRRAGRRHRHEQGRSQLPLPHQNDLLHAIADPLLRQPGRPRRPHPTHPTGPDGVRPARGLPQHADRPQPDRGLGRQRQSRAEPPPDRRPAPPQHRAHVPRHHRLHRRRRRHRPRDSRPRIPVAPDPHPHPGTTCHPQRCPHLRGDGRLRADQNPARLTDLTSPANPEGIQQRR